MNISDGVVLALAALVVVDIALSKACLRSARQREASARALVTEAHALMKANDARLEHQGGFAVLLQTMHQRVSLIERTLNAAWGVPHSSEESSAPAQPVRDEKPAARA